jgi:hypothetical protein
MTTAPRGRRRALPALHRPSIGRQTFPLAEGRRVYESGGHTRRPGKTVLVVR